MNPDDLNQPEPQENDEEPRAAVEPETEPDAEMDAEIEPEAETLLNDDTVLVPYDDVEIPPEDEETVPTADEPPVIAPEPAPNSAAPPRIIAETPLGGAPRLHPAARIEPPEPDAGKAVALDKEPEEAPFPAELLATEPEETPSPAEPIENEPEEVPIEGERLEPKLEEASPIAEPLEKEAESAPAVEAQPREAPAPVEVRAPKPDQPPSRVVVTDKPTADWDEDLSPELAAVLFGERQAKPEARAEIAAPAPAEVVPAVAPAAATLPAAPAALTDMASARAVRITAKGHHAAAPETTLQGKVRYVRIEEPQKRNQRITEIWTYFKPDYPAVEGRLVRRATSEEMVYDDGSRRWRYERQYSDRGRDRREVRISADKTYVERKDEASTLDPQTGKPVTHKETGAMIQAAQEHEEKRGFLSGLLGRDEDETGGAKVWREATSSESRQARKQGGQAFRRRFLGIF